MEIKVVAGDITQQKAGAIIVNLFEGVTAPEGATGAVDRSLDGAISRLIEEGEIKGKRGEMTLIHTLGKMAPSRVVVAGLGKASDFSIEAVRFVSAESCRYIRRVGVESVATIAHGAGVGGLDARAVGQAIAEGSTLGLYRFDKYKSGNEDKRNIQEFTIVESDDGKVKELEAGVADGQIIADAVNFCRDMANEPANTMTPTRMAEMALEAARESGLELEVLDRPQMTELGMGALLGVAQGSDEPPKFIILRYKGDPTDESNNLGILGKGITFDSGGLDIKSASGMSTMKGDMAGGAAVISAMQAIGKLKPKINITAIVPATENMPGGRAQRPGDVVRAMNGKTSEIDNTDAEGRLVLADAAAYARSINLTRIVDVATLTGAVVMALGSICTGAFGNDQDFIDQIVAAGNEVGERMWQLPMYDDYKEGFKSDIADIKNTGGRGAGSITGAQIIGEFVEGASWVHLDIAGTARTESDKGYAPKGASGVPVRTLINLAQNLSKK
ncbi:MAG: leucyl aminopeptidase [Chloroflexi bacterium]|nr:leucyl aminopeptidase [Chloroflexota bacterium]